jgi:hypothetical protein
VALIALILLLAAEPAPANTFNVTNTNDSGSGSLRRTIEDANNNAGSDTINISATGTINLQLPLPNLSNVEINGPGASQLTVRRDTGGNHRIFSIVNGNVTINGLTISNGRDSFGGGGIYISNSGTATLTNSTLNNNSAPASGGVANLYRESGSATLKNTIVANPQSGGANCHFISAINSQGNNLEYPGTSCGFTQPTDKQNQDPLLGTLQNNGGPTQTHALGTNSPAIEAGTNTGCPATDQRGE